MSRYQVEPDSPTSARILEPIVLWTSDDGTRRLGFLPHIHENPNDPEACISGELRYQRKQKGGVFVDDNSLQLSRLRKEEWTKYELRSGATLALFRALSDLYEVYAQDGTPRGSRTILSLEGDLSSELNALGQDHAARLLGVLLHQLANTNEPKQLLTQLAVLGPDAVSNLRHAAGIVALRSALEEWPNLDRKDESSWQGYLETQQWILAQAFCQPVVLFRPGASVSPPTLSRRHQQLIDFVYTNALTNNLILVEIKTPVTPLVTDSPYRGETIYSPSRELVGAVAQISAYRHNVKRHAHSVLRDTDKAALRSDPLCVVVVGEVTQLDDQGKMETFDQYRRELRNIEILGFDELHHRAQSMLQLLEEPKPVKRGQAED